LKFDRERLRQTLSGYTPQRLPLEDLRPAAVLVVIFSKGGRDHLLFTRRTEHLPHHRGEISFLGGGQDPEDQDLLVTALRESDEELGIRPDAVTVFGQLDDVISIHGYRVTPYVGEIPHPYPYRVNRDEIETVLELPLDAFFDPEIYRVEDWSWQGRIHPVRFYSVGGEEVWGMTAEIVHQFLTLLLPLRGGN
jgi:8-oxo-dGTP pyrophosphatase MutT (NUDIX family)